MPRKRFAALVAAALAVMWAVVFISDDPTRDEAPASVSEPANQTLVDGSFMLGAYDAPILLPRSPGEIPRINIPATLQALLDAHVDTYAYLIYPGDPSIPEVSQTQFEDFPRFAAAARDAGIRVYAYLVPPTEAPRGAYPPFDWDYVAWARAIGRLAAANPAIRGIMMDDFGGNTFARPSGLFFFTPAYVESMMGAARASAPWLTFIPILYHHDMVGSREVLTDYRALVQAVVFPYHGASDGKAVPGNTRDPSLALLQGQEVARLLKCRSRTPCSQFVFPARTALDQTTDAAAVTGTASLPSGREHRLSFELKNNLNLGTPSDYVVEVLVDGEKVVSLGSTKDRRPYSVTFFTPLNGAGQPVDVRVEIRIRRAPSGARKQLAVNVDSVGFSSAAGQIVLDRLAADTSPAVRHDWITSIPLIYMTYAIPLKAERGVGASPAYVARILGDIAVLKDQGLVDGSLVFKMPLAPSMTVSSTNYSLIQDAYRRWSGR